MSINKREKGLLLVGGASRNVGKTSFVCEVINKFSKELVVIGLKIKTIYTGDNYFHGKDRNPLDSDFRLIEELDFNSVEDTGKMLRSGATKVFSLKVKNEALEEAFTHFKKQIVADSLIICESNSLRRIIKSDLFLLIKHRNEQNMKPSAKEMEKFADKIIYTDGDSHDFGPDEIEIENNLWNLKVEEKSRQ